MTDPEREELRAAAEWHEDLARILRQRESQKNADLHALAARVLRALAEAETHHHRCNKCGLERSGPPAKRCRQFLGGKYCWGEKFTEFILRPDTKEGA